MLMRRICVLIHEFVPVWTELREICWILTQNKIHREVSVARAINSLRTRILDGIYMQIEIRAAARMTHQCVLFFVTKITRSKEFQIRCRISAGHSKPEQIYESERKSDASTHKNR